jgi:carbonic anhydrase/acetyltransferase-like protein (isoleucine patch superfamily)
MMVTEPVALFLLLSTAVTIGMVVVGAGVSALWFLAVIRKSGLRVRFAAS